jgi:RNA polymerase sigma-70 factor (ECF subfamily)
MCTEKIWKEINPSLRNYIRSKVSDSNDIEDLMQDIFIKSHQNIGQLKDETKVKAWLFRISRNIVNDYYRKKYSSVEHIEYKDDMLSTTDKEISYDNDIAICIKPMLDDLPDIYKEAIILTEFKNMTQKELSNYLEISLSGAKSRVQRGRKMLKKVLVDCCHIEFDCMGNVIDYQQNKKTKYC